MLCYNTENTRREVSATSDILFEREHSAIGSFPYIQFENENLNFIAHYHKEIELVYVERGSIRAFSGAVELPLQTGDICFFMPGEIHSYQTLSANNIYVFKLSPHSYVEHIDFETIRLNKNMLTPEDETYAYFKSLIDEMREEYLTQRQGYEFAIRHCKNQIILALLRCFPHITSDHKKDIKILNTVNQYLNENYSRRLELEEVARACHFSKFYFAHKIKELSGMTYIGYLTAFRLDKATELLAMTDTKITDVAHQCGVGELRSFHRAFRSCYHMTPSEFRKNIRAGKRERSETEISKNKKST